jgi:hypothetical protein
MKFKNTINYSSQSAHLSKGYFKKKDVANSFSVNTKEILKLKKNLEEKGGEYLATEKSFNHLMDSYNYWENKCLKALRSIDREMTYIQIVSKAEVLVKRVYPIRWMMLLISNFGAVAFNFIFYTIKSRRIKC